VELLQEITFFPRAGEADAAGTEAAWKLLRTGAERIEALPEIAPPAGAAAPRTLEALRLEAQRVGCHNLGCAPLRTKAPACKAGIFCNLLCNFMSQYTPCQCLPLQMCWMSLLQVAPQKMYTEGFVGATVLQGYVLCTAYNEAKVLL